MNMAVRQLLIEKLDVIFNKVLNDKMFQIIRRIKRKCLNFFNLKGDEEILATTPNLIVVVESDSGVALQTEELKFGIRVSILVIPG